jgi:hypothetical protein
MIVGYDTTSRVTPRYTLPLIDIDSITSRAFQYLSATTIIGPPVYVTSHHGNALIRSFSLIRFINYRHSNVIQ